jgi:O-methyltransferase
MVFDDYGFLTCPGAKKAVDEFFSDKREYPCYLPTGQAIVTKL